MVSLSDLINANSMGKVKSVAVNLFWCDLKSKVKKKNLVMHAIFFKHFQIFEKASEKSLRTNQFHTSLKFIFLLRMKTTALNLLIIFSIGVPHFFNFP